MSKRNDDELLADANAIEADIWREFFSPDPLSSLKARVDRLAAELARERRVAAELRRLLEDQIDALGAGVDALAAEVRRLAQAQMKALQATVDALQAGR